MKNKIRKKVSQSPSDNYYYGGILRQLWHYSSIGYTFTQEYINECYLWKIFYEGEYASSGTTQNEDNYADVLSAYIQHHREFIIDQVTGESVTKVKKILSYNKIKNDDFFDF